MAAALAKKRCGEAHRRARFGTDDGEGFRRKLIYYSAAMIVTPLVTYNLSMTRFVPYLYEKYGTEFLENPTTCSGLFAILSVQVVLVMYVISALREDGSSPAKKRE